MARPIRPASDCPPPLCKPGAGAFRRRRPQPVEPRRARVRRRIAAPAVAASFTASRTDLPEQISATLRGQNPIHVRDVWNHRCSSISCTESHRDSAAKSRNFDLDVDSWRDSRPGAGCRPCSRAAWTTCGYASRTSGFTGPLSPRPKRIDRASSRYPRLWGLNSYTRSMVGSLVRLQSRERLHVGWLESRRRLRGTVISVGMPQP